MKSKNPNKAQEVKNPPVSEKEKPDKVSRNSLNLEKQLFGNKTQNENGDLAKTQPTGAAGNIYDDIIGEDQSSFHENADEKEKLSVKGLCSNCTIIF